MHIIMKNDKEIVGTLLGFDDFVNMVSISWIYISAEKYSDLFFIHDYELLIFCHFFGENIF
jgi:small nuclear ribonucleoprotein (snRNP)-like protein